MKSSYKHLSAPVVFAFAILLSTSVLAQNKVVREIAPFDQVKISDDLKVTFKKSDKEKITIVANGIGYDKIVTESSGRVLKIKVKTGIYKNTDVQIEVEYVDLRMIDASNKADVKFNEPLVVGELTLKSSGSAVINVEAQVSALKASLSNGGRIEISGKADLQQVEANLGSKYNAYEFETEKGYVKSNTNSDVVVWATQYLEASAGSKAELKYRGKPEDVKTNSSLGGKIQGDL